MRPATMGWWFCVALSIVAITLGRFDDVVVWIAAAAVITALDPGP